MNILAISSRYANRTHGTGVQLLDYYRAFEPRWRHVCWTPEAPTGEEPPGTLNLDNSWSRYWPFEMSAQQIDAIQSRLGLASRIDGKLNPRRLRQVHRQLQASNVAHVIVASETDAATANQLLDELAIPAVVHWMDFVHLNGLDSCSQIHRLNARASAVYAISERLAQTIEPYCQREIPIVRCGRRMVTASLRTQGDSNLVQAVMLGSLTLRRGIEEIRRFLEAMQDCIGDLCFVLNYLGTEAMARKLSGLITSERVKVRYRGYVTDPQVLDALLASMDVALLPGPDGDPMVSSLARYSVPSRLGDYLWFGLPVATWVHPESATAEFLRTGEDDFVFRGRDGADCARMVNAHLNSSPSSRANVSARARAFAQIHLDNARSIARLRKDFQSASMGTSLPHADARLP